MRAHRAGSGTTGTLRAESEEHPILGTSQTKHCHPLQTPAEGLWGWTKPPSTAEGPWDRESHHPRQHNGLSKEPPGSFHPVSFVSGLLCKWLMLPRNEKVVSQNTKGCNYLISSRKAKEMFLSLLLLFPTAAQESAAPKTGPACPES